MDLAVEINFIMDYHNTEVSFFGRDRDASIGEIVRLAEVEEFHDDCIVDMTHHVDVVETEL